MPSIAWSSAQSSKTMLAAFPPSSSVCGTPRPASSRWIALPTSVEPVKATLSMPLWRTSSAPVDPSPVMMLTAPAGSSACRQTSAKSRAVSGVVSAGVVEEVGRGERQVDVARLLDRLAAVERLGHGQLAASLLEDAGDAEQ